jgi:hypothetical protein
VSHGRDQKAKIDVATLTVRRVEGQAVALPWRLILVFGSVALLLVQELCFLGFTIDDAFISFRYA